MPVASALPETPLVLDNDVLTDWRYQKAHTRRYIDEYIIRLGKAPALTAVTVFEAFHGFELIEKKKKEKEGGIDERTQQDRAQAEKLIGLCEVLPFNQTAAVIAAYIFARLSQSDRNKHWCDVFIAATALAHNHGVATRNQSDFELIAKHLPSDHFFLRLAVWKV
jgi:predicted nucleic acid-binding protein